MTAFFVEDKLPTSIRFQLESSEIQDDCSSGYIKVLITLAYFSFQFGPMWDKRHWSYTAIECVSEANADDPYDRALEFSETNGTMQWHNNYRDVSGTYEYSHMDPSGGGQYFLVYVLQE